MTSAVTALREMAGEFVRREVAPHLQDWEDAGEVPRSLHLAAAKQGLLGVSFPESVGGEGGDLLDTIAVQEAMFEAGASSGLMAALFTGGIALPHIAASGDPDLVDRFVRPTLAGEKIGALAITEPDGGSDVAAIRTTARRDGDAYVVDGTKTFITSGVRADFVTVAVRTGGPGATGISCWSSRRARRGSPSTGPCRRWAGTARTPPSWASRRAGCPWPTWSGPRGRGSPRSPSSSWSSGSRLAVHGYGIAARSLALTAAYVQERQTFGRPLVGRQVVRHQLVEMHRQVDVARTYTRAIAARHVAGEDVVAEACLAKQTAVEAALAVCDRAVQLHGGTGYLHGTEVERHYRDARILPIGGGATEVLTDLAARLLGYS